MAKSQSKKPVATAVSKALSPVVVARTALVPLFLTGAQDAVAASTKSRDRQASIIAAIGVLFSTSKDYAADCVTLFGNGLRGDKKVSGDIADALTAAKVSALTIAGLLSETRTVAANWYKAEVQKAGTDTGLRAAYKVAKPKAATESTSKDDATKPGKALSAAETVASIIEAVGLAALLGMAESAMLARKDTIRAGYVHDARIKVS